MCADRGFLLLTYSFLKEAIIMTKQFDLKRISMIAVAVVIATCLVNCTNKKDVAVIKEGLVSVNGQKIILAENSNKNEPLWLLAGDLSGEALGTIVTRSAADDKATISGAAYVTPEGDGFSVTLGAEGYPQTISFTDGSSMELKNYKDTTVEITLTASTGEVVGTQTVKLDDTFKELKDLIAANGLTFSTARSSAEKSKSGVFTTADYASEARTRKTVIKITSTVLSIAGCAGAIFISEVAPPIALIACTSAYAGVVSTVDYISDTGGFNPGDEAGQLSFYLSAGACAGLSIPDCVSTLLNIADAAIADCMPSKEHYVKGCYRGNVYWYDNCGGRTDPEQECPCGCEGGACKPAAACQDLKLKVSAGADPACMAKSETIFFASTVTGGDPASYVYAWDFGDGGSSALDSDAHTYSTAGHKSVTLTVSDSKGNYGFAAIGVQVEDCENFLEASIGASAGCVKKNETVIFSSIVRGGDKASITYQWNFGDGGTGTEKDVTHSYSSDGLYLVSLIVEDGLGNRAIDAVTIEVGDCPGETDTSTTSSSSSTTTSVGSGNLTAAECDCLKYITLRYEEPDYSGDNSGCICKIFADYAGPLDLSALVYLSHRNALNINNGVPEKVDAWEFTLAHPAQYKYYTSKGQLSYSYVDKFGAILNDRRCDWIRSDPEKSGIALYQIEEQCHPVYTP
jgi:hypothetical protein